MQRHALHFVSAFVIFSQQLVLSALFNGECQFVLADIVNRDHLMAINLPLVFNQQLILKILRDRFHTKDALSKTFKSPTQL